MSEAERKRLYLEICINILQVFRWKLTGQVIVSFAAGGGQVVEEMEKWWRARRERWGFVMAEDG